MLNFDVVSASVVVVLILLVSDCALPFALPLDAWPQIINSFPMVISRILEFSC